MNRSIPYDRQNLNAIADRAGVRIKGKALCERPSLRQSSGKEQQDRAAVGVVAVGEVAGVADAQAGVVAAAPAPAQADFGGEVAVGVGVAEEVGPARAGVDEEVVPGFGQLHAVLEDPLIELCVEVV